MDKISNLPDEIIVHILSFLSIEEAATTSLLSKRWRDMFVFTPNLHLVHTKPRTTVDLNVHQKNFIDFVDRVLLAVSENSAIKRFTLRYHVASALWNRWILNVLKRGVLELDIHVFACKTLVKLRLSDFNVTMVPEDAYLPAIKSLSLYRGRFEDRRAFEKLISACSSLEELIINQIRCEFWKSSPILSSLTLKRLISWCYSQNSGRMSFDHPSLLFLRYGGFQDQYPVVNLDSLVEAELELLSFFVDHNPSNLIKGLRNVKILTLLTPQTVEFFGIFREAIPVFENLVQLSISYQKRFCLHGSHVLSLLNKTPNLQTLVIVVLELTEYEGDDTKVVEQMKHFLKGFSCLELVKVCTSAKDDKEKLRLTTDLQMLPRASSKCKFKVEFSCKQTN